MELERSCEKKEMTGNSKFAGLFEFRGLCLLISNIMLLQSGSTSSFRTLA